MLSRKAASVGERAAVPPRLAGFPAAERGGRIRPSRVPARPSAVPASEVLGVLRGPSQPLATPLREEMESRLDTDLADVRVHTGAEARASAAGLGARAYTAGRHVVIGETGADRHTLVHELAHVVQQRQGQVAATGNGAGLRISDPSDGFEQQAEATARRVPSGAAPDGTALDRTVRRAAPRRVPADPVTETAVPPVQRTLKVQGAKVTSTADLKDIKDKKGSPATSPSFFTESPDAWRELLGNNFKDKMAREN